MPRIRDVGDGGLFRMPGSRFWYLQFYKDGQKVRESSKTTNKQEARNMLQTRMGRDEVPGKSKLKYADVRALLMSEYISQGRSLIQTNAKTGKPYVCGLNYLDDFFAGRTAAKITTDDLRRYIEHRKAAQPDAPANATINREMALLRRMLYLAKRENKLASVPHFPMLPEAEARQGFVDQENFDKLFTALPEKYRPFVLYLYTTGPRSGESKKLDWSQVDLVNGMIRVKGSQSKNDEARTIPICKQLLKILRKNPGSGPLFPVGNFRKSWNRACVQAGLGTLVKGPENGGYGTYSGLIPHDLRRSAIRNMLKSKNSEGTVMKISGHKTRAVFDRYNIVDEKDQREAMSKRDAHFGSSLVQIGKGAKGKKSLTSTK